MRASGWRNARRGNTVRWGVLCLAIVVATQPALPVSAGATRFDTRHAGRKAMASVVQFERASIWSLHVTSQRLLADYGYAMEYTFEFLDEEELRVQGLGQQEITSGRVLTILDGELVEAEIQLRGESTPLLVNYDGYRLVAAWRHPDRLVPTDLPPEEIERRLKVLSDLRAETRRRLGLAQFRPSRDARVPLRIAAVDTIALVPADDARELYEVKQPMTAAVTEVLVREADGRRWEITWGRGALQVQLNPVLTTLKTTVSYREGQATGLVGTRVPLHPMDAAQIAATAFAYLQAARQYFGTVSITAPLPAR